MGVYIMHCHREEDDKLIHYIGYTAKSDPELRIKEHRSGTSKYTRRLRDAGFKFTLGAFYPAATRTTEMQMKKFLTAADKRRRCKHCEG